MRRLLLVAALSSAAAAGAVAQQPARPGQRPAPRAGRDTAAADTAAPALEYRREVFSYRGGTRDPFATLITTSDVRPTIADLTLISIIYAPPANSVAVVRETGNPRPHRLRVGRQVGRLRVIQIQRYRVVFQIEEFGFERQEVLELQRGTGANP